MPRAVVALLAFAAGCYHPAETASCRVSCEDDSQCPDSLPCGADGLCHAATVTCGADGGRLVDSAPVVDAADGSAGIDAAIIDAPPGEDCVGAVLHICGSDSIASADLTLGPNPLDTDTSLLCITPTPLAGACVAMGSNVTVHALRVTGGKPLVIAALHGITVDGVVDVSVGGAASNTSGCTFAMAPTNDASGGGGGAGGSFGGSGGTGGNGDASGGGRPGAASMDFTSLRGGCDGQAGFGNDGGVGATPGNGGGVGGRSGGAIALVSGGSIALASGGAIDASGGGGAAGAIATGGAGGGGGTGGYIGFDLPTTANLQFGPGLGVYANGGGGGGGDQVTSTASQPGGNGSRSTTAAPGGTTVNGTQGAGGAGSPNARPGFASAGGGGGGGGGGDGMIVVLHGPTPTGIDMSPGVTIE